VLVTGGAGYIGSHVARLLKQSGSFPIVVDDFSTGLRPRLYDIPTIELDLSDSKAVSSLEGVINKYRVKAAIHLAALKQADESVFQPETYFTKNIGGFSNLLTAMRNTGVTKLVFSSSAAVYGNTSTELTSEEHATEPINPYGQTKLIGEWMAKNAETAWGLSHVSLRYFNVAGAGWADLADTQKLNLIPIAFETLKEGSALKIFGDDHPTKDGTCIRDYIHVMDLANAHLKALDYLGRPDRLYPVFNVGTGVGHSVIEVLETIGSTIGLPFKYEILERRPEASYSVADVTRATEVLGWKSQLELNDIIKSAC
jgi:UDP-glucose 4-epimerase